MTEKHYKLIGPDGNEVLSAVPGTLGGNRRRKIYGRLDCRSAVGSLPTGYAKHRVFFADEATAIAAGAKLQRPVQNQFYGDRSGLLTDPFGHVWTIATHIEEVPHEEMLRRAAEMMK